MRFRPDGFRDLHFPEVRAPELILTEDHRAARVGIHHAPIKAATSRARVCMPPKVAELGPLSGYDEQRRRRDLRLPARPRRSMALRQPHVAQRGFQAFTNDSAVAKPDFIHARESIRCHSVPASVDDEHSDARKRQDRLSAPFLDKLRRHHRETGERPSRWRV